MRNSRKIGIAAVAVGLLAAAGVWFWLVDNSDETYTYFTAEVSRGSILNTVVATGSVEPVITVEVGSQVSGQIQTLYADFNSMVRAGQLLAKIDPRDIEAQLENSRASLVAARARIRTAEADLVNARANIAAAEANLEASRAEAEEAEINYRRSEELAAAELIAQTELENARVTAGSARARVVQSEASLEQAQAQIISREAGVEQAYAQVVQAEADVNQREVNLEYTNITSPVDGVVISREVDVGQTVAASMSAPILFMIANDLSQMRVNAAIDEADIGRLAQRNEVEFTVDAYPNERFRGEIEEIRINPQTTQNVVTYNVIVGVSNPDLKLKPGMTANITVTVDRRDNVTAVPNTALRYMPPDVDPAQIRQTTLQGRGGGRGIWGQNGSARAATVESGGAILVPEAEAAFRGAEEGVRGRSGPAGNGFPGGFPRAVEGDPGGPVGTTVAAEPDSAPTLGQLWDQNAKIQFQDVAQAPPHPGQVWVLNAESVPEIRSLMLGITDGSRSEVVSGDIAEGEIVVIGDSSQGAAESENQGDINRNMFRMMRGGR